MSCFKPRDGYDSGYITHNGKKRIVFNPAKAADPTIIPIPCGSCIGCRLDKARSWALRCWHESKLHEENCFITLTYDDYHLPDNRSLDKEHFGKFIRALRKKTKRKIRYYMCGEYGSRCEKHREYDCPECGALQRPHYHAILFGYQFPDAYKSGVRKGNTVYRSTILERLWEKGTSEISAATYKSAGYVARYIMKKQGGEQAIEHYGKRIPEFTKMSLKPGIGADYYLKFPNDFREDYAITPDGRKTAVPEYYRRIMLKNDPDLHETLKEKRIAKATDNPNNTDERLEVRERIQEKKAQRLKREI